MLFLLFGCVSNDYLGLGALGYDDNGSEDVLRWGEQSLPGDDAGTSLSVLANGTFSVGEDAAFSLDLWGSGRDGRSDRGDDLLEAGDDRSEVRRFTYEEVNITVNTDDAGGMPDLNVLLEAYRVTLALDLSYVDLSGSDLSERKPTLLLLETYNRLSPGKKEELETLLGLPEYSKEQIERVRSLMQDSGAEKIVCEMADFHVDEALRILHEFPDSVYRSLLEDFLGYLVNRAL